MIVFKLVMKTKTTIFMIKLYSSYYFDIDYVEVKVIEYYGHR